MIGRYRISSLLGKGGMGTVYRAVDSTLDRQVALKILPPEMIQHSDRLERFIREAKTASSLNHPHLVPIYEVGSDLVGGETIHFIAMELVEGGTLRQRMTSGRLELRRALQLLSQVADAVAAAHAAGITHRDLKPENIIVSDAGYAKVLDFGLAKLRTAESDDDAKTAVRGTDSGVVMGTVGYMSPEQAQGRTADGRSDIFSLGCILYELVAGRRAFQGDSSVDTLHKIINAQPERLAAQRPDSPLELQRIVSKTLEKDPDERYQSMKELSIDLRHLIRELESNPSDVMTVSSHAPAPIKTPRRSLAIVGIVAFVLVAIAGLMIWLRPTSAPEAPAARSPMKITRLTSLGKVISASISPDGKFITYVVSDQGVQSLWLRQIATGRDLELIPPERQFYWSHTFSLDGNSIVFGLKSPKEPLGAFYEISTLGGTPRHLLSGIDSAPSFSPDGKRMTYVRAAFPTRDQSALMIANVDGTGATALTTRKQPKRFAPVFFTGPSWSPDGSSIAVSENSFEGKVEARLIEVESTSGKERVVSTGWRSLAQITHLPDRTGLIAIGETSEGSQSSLQIWFVPASGDRPERITGDLLDYRLVSLSSDGKSLVTVGAEAESAVWRMSLDGGIPERLTRERLDGMVGTAILPDKNILFASFRGVVSRISKLGPDGKIIDLTRADEEARYPAPDAGGSSMLYVAMTTEGAELRWMSLTGNRIERVLAKGIDVGQPAAISPDGKWAVYADDGRLKKVSTEGANPALEWSLPGYVQLPAISPDGKRVAFYQGDEGGPETKIAVVSIDGGPVVWSSQAAAYPRYGTSFRWAPTSEGFILNTMLQDRANLWYVPLKGEPRKLTEFNDQNTGWFDVSRDGKTFVFSRFSHSRDAVLITNFR